MSKPGLSQFSPWRKLRSLTDRLTCFSIRNQAQKQWHDLFRRGTCCVTGFGYFAERAEVDGFPYYNTSLNGRGDQYPDPSSKFLAGEDSYVLLTVKRGGPMTVEIKSLKNTVLDRRDFERRKERP